MKRLLLISTSTTHGTRYLEHCEPQIRSHLAGLTKILFVPYAVHDMDAYAAAARRRFAELGLALDSVHEAADPPSAVETAEAVFIGGGNTFRLLSMLHRHHLIEPLRRRVGEGMPYMGSSAGSNVACPTICTTNDMPIVQPPSFEALDLVPFQINAHYQAPDPNSTHMGETRDQRLEEFLEENAVPVVALREGAMLEVADSRITLRGSVGGRLFARGISPQDLEPGQHLDQLAPIEALALAP